MAALRASPEGVAEAALTALWPDRRQARRALDGLVADGLAQRRGATVTLP
jgi:A/G-specific adenine glycosylase